MNHTHSSAAAVRSSGNGNRPWKMSASRGKSAKAIKAATKCAANRNAMGRPRRSSANDRSASAAVTGTTTIVSGGIAPRAASASQAKTSAAITASPAPRGTGVACDDRSPGWSRIARRRSQSRINTVRIALPNPAASTIAPAIAAFPSMRAPHRPAEAAAVISRGGVACNRLLVRPADGFRGGKGSMAAGEERFRVYHAAVAGRPPRATLLRALAAFEVENRVGFAVDLGAGEGRDAVALLQRGWAVLAIDSDAAALVRLRARRDRSPRAKLVTLHRSFVDAVWPS